jgi:hypothetical protein
MFVAPRITELASPPSTVHSEERHVISFMLVNAAIRVRALWVHPNQRFTAV